MEIKQRSVTPNRMINPSFFTSNKDKTNAFFKCSKVGSCSFVLVKNGQSLAMPFKIKNDRGRKLNHYRTVPEKSGEVKSVYMKDFNPFPNLHCGMGKKPLLVYDPESYRSRLPIKADFMNRNNKSSVDFGESGVINRKQWHSTYKDNYRWPKAVPVSNPGILSDMARSSHSKLNSFG